MMKEIWVFGRTLMLVVILVSCENDESGEEKFMSSNYNGKESHNTGQDCMSCHKSGGKGEGIFTVAGTIYNNNRSASYPNATVKLYTGANGTGTLVKTIEVDGKGNFYTTEEINFGSGLYTTVTGTTGSVSKMATTLSSGQCNSCHNSVSDKIGIN
jgi:hypothetical protein